VLSKTWEHEFFESFRLKGKYSVLFVTQKSWKFPIFQLFRLATFHFLKTFFINFLFLVNRIDKKCFWEMGTRFYWTFSTPRQKLATVSNSKILKFSKFWLFRLTTFHFLKTFLNILFLVNRINLMCFLRHGNMICSKVFVSKEKIRYCL